MLRYRGLGFTESGVLVGNPVVGGGGVSGQVVGGTSATKMAPVFGKPVASSYAPPTLGQGQTAGDINQHIISGAGVVTPPAAQTAATPVGQTFTPSDMSQPPTQPQPADSGSSSGIPGTGLPFGLDTNTLLLIGGGVLLLILLLRRQAPAAPVAAPAQAA
jgi:hypothetical protein